VAATSAQAVVGAVHAVTAAAGTTHATHSVTCSASRLTSELGLVALLGDWHGAAT
jgi:hypothetical protein